MNYTPSAFKSPEVAIEEIPNFYKAQPTIPEITPELKATIARMCSKVSAKLTSSQKNILEKSEQCGMEYQLDITVSPNWNDFVDSVYQWEDFLEESSDLQLSWNEAKYDPVALSQKVSKGRGEESA
ncbi:MAG: hypothetical protein NWS20_05300, partial [Rickettsiaceae bacterium]|nr:hypothetical protein [Rickettsiaceae bacterium]